MGTRDSDKNDKEKRYDPEKGASFRTWLFRIAKNLAIDRLRQMGREVTFSDFEGEEGEEGEGEAFWWELHSDQPSLEDVLMAKEWRKAVHECMEKLPPREREAIALWGDMTLEDLASILGVSVPTAHRVLRRAFQLMKECLERKGWGP